MSRTFHLSNVPRRVEQRCFGTGALEVAVLGPEELLATVDGLAPPPGTVPSRAAAIARAARRFTDSADPLRKEAERELPAITGFSAQMIAETLPLVFAPIGESVLTTAVANPGGAWARRVAIVAAGNVLGVAIAKTALALVAGVACFVKTGSGEPLLSALFARALDEESAALGAAHAVAWWPGGSVALERVLAGAVDAMIAYGSDASVAALGVLGAPHFVGHGHRLSAAVVRLGAGGSTSDLAARAARDVALYDQQGCLSPQTIFTLSGDVAADEFATALAAALADLAERLPRGRVDQGTHVAIRRLRDECEWRAIRGERVDVLADPEGTAWTVIRDATLGWRANPLHRSVIVHALDESAALTAALVPVASRLESIGVAPWPDREITEIVASLRVPRITALGTMQSPGLDWRQGGLDPLAGLALAAQVRAR